MDRTMGDHCRALALVGVVACGSPDESATGDSTTSTTDAMETSTSENSSTEAPTSTGVDTSTGEVDASTDESSTSGGVVDLCDRDDSIDLDVQTLDPVATDAQISMGFVHVYVDPAGADRLLLRNAAAGGYHAIGLSYRNEVAVNDLCTVGEAGCHAAVRNEVITGEDTSPLVEITRADSIDHRLVAALQYLGWDDYLDDDALRWTDITVAGHSQGGGHAAFIAQLREVNRAVLFAATEPADWTEEALATDVERLFGFVHADDPQRDAMVLSWERLGVPGDIVVVEDVEPPYDDSQRLQTSLASDNAHGAVAVDSATPLSGDVPVYSDVWCQLVGP
jgi:pimeloyl-ACP methyl ester carboxylesterase